MKQIYTKPTLILESFTLSQNIAQMCEGVYGDNSFGGATQADPNTCVWSMGNFSLFTATNSNCNIPLGENDKFEGICLHNPDGGTAVFGS